MTPTARALLALTVLPLGCASAPTSSDASVADVADASVADVTDAPPRDAPSPTPRCPGGVAMPYPDAREIVDEAPVPPFEFAGASGPVSLRGYYAPCAARPDLVVVRVMAAWSGHSRWHASHTRALRATPLGARVRVLDLLVLDAQNLPATARALAPWRAVYDVAPDALAADAAYTLRPYFLAAPRLPLVLALDPRTMRPLEVLESPTGEDLSAALARAAARLDGTSPPPRPEVTLVDGRFTPDEWAFLQTMRVTSTTAPPRDTTNRVADDARAAALGERLFHDAGLSSTGATSCATCHARERAFADGRPRGVGLAPLDRNTPTVLGAAWMRWQFWDGRVDSLWAQALAPVENPVEMNLTRLELAHRVAARHRDAWTAVFGPLPPLDDGARFPPRGRPGDDAWARMTAADREAIDRVFANFGKAVAAYERTLRPAPAPLDRYLGGDATAMTARARDGLRVFLDAGCAQCHHGPMLTDDSFHNVGMGTGRVDGAPDPGRWAGVEALRAWAFRADSAFSDDRAAGAAMEAPARVEAMRGMFRTAPLRNAARTGPWGHGGTFATLESVVIHYGEVAINHRGAPGSAGDPDPHLVGFHRSEVAAERMADALRAMSE